MFAWRPARAPQGSRTRHREESVRPVKLFEAVLAVGDAVTWRLPTAVQIAAVWAGACVAVRAVAAPPARRVPPQQPRAQPTLLDAKVLPATSTEASR